MEECGYCEGQGGYFSKDAPDAEEEYFSCEVCGGTGALEQLSVDN